jgi:hypothetical protein
MDNRVRSGTKRRLGGRRARRNVRRRDMAGLFMDRSNESKSSPRQGSNEALLLAVVADGRPRRIDAGPQGRFRNDTPLPNPSQQVILGDHPITVPDQVCQEIDRDGVIAGSKLPSIQIQHVSLERVTQFPSLAAA